MLSVVIHTTALALAVIMATRIMNTRVNSTAHVADSIAHITWIAQPSHQPGEPPGGSGQNSPAPARPMQRPGVDAVAVPASPSSDPTRIEKTVDSAPLNLPAVPSTAGIQELPGVIAALTSAPSDSDGPGSGDRQGSGRGPGAGPGDGTGIGNGYLPGNGVTSPRLLREVKPGYTGEAMRARIQGVVRLQAVVLPDGSVGRMKVVRSLDHTFGLDEEALKSVSQWRFQPGTLAGRAVPVLIEVELAFTLR